MTKTTKINIEIALSRNYDKVTLGMLDEPITHENDEDFAAEVKKRFKKIKDLIVEEFQDIQK